jgi:hypothetical protein
MNCKRQRISISKFALLTSNLLALQTIHYFNMLLHLYNHTHNKYITNVIYIEIALERSGGEISCYAATLHIQDNPGHPSNAKG